MIEINLIPGKKQKAARGKGLGLKLSLPDFRGRIRDSLVAEIGIIRGIDADRYIWPHMLDQITKALPPYTWLTSIAVAGGSNVAPGSPGATAAGGAVDSVGVPIVRAWITGSTV